MLPLAILSLAFNHQSSAGQLDYILEGGDPGQPHLQLLVSFLQGNDKIARNAR